MLKGLNVQKSKGKKRNRSTGNQVLELSHTDFKDREEKMENYSRDLETVQLKIGIN